MPSLALWIALGGCAALVAAAAGYLFYRVYRAHQWERAWATLPTNPRRSLQLLRGFMGNGIGAARGQRARAALGQTLCLLRLGRPQEAEQCLAKAGGIVRFQLRISLPSAMPI